MAILEINEAPFNKITTATLLDTINSRIYLLFNKPNHFKRIDQIMIDAIDIASGGFQSAAGVDFLIQVTIIKGRQTTFLASTPPISTSPAFPSPQQFEGDVICNRFLNVTKGQNVLTFQPSLLFDAAQWVAVTIPQAFRADTGATIDVNATATVFGSYLPRRNANLTKEAYLNPDLK